jgi:DNA-binding MarR family transcriptional regulator
MTTAKFNINNSVRVRLTPKGREILAEIAKTAPPAARDAWVWREDEQGWSRWSMWELMSLLGKYCYIGNTQLPFETEIEINLE